MADGDAAVARAAALRKDLLDMAKQEREDGIERNAAPDAATLNNVNARFQKQVLDDSASSAVYGLKTREEFLSAQEELEKSARKRANPDDEDDEEAEQREAKRKRKLDKKLRKQEKARKKKKKTLLSFGDEEEEEEEEQQEGEQGEQEEQEEQEEEQEEQDHGKEKKKKTTKTKKRKTPAPASSSALGKNPAVDTHFLPDRERDEARRAEEKKRKDVWEAEQAALRQEKLRVVYSFWDGSGNRRALKVTKGTTVGDFLEVARKQLMPDIAKLKHISADSLMYVKEDLIIPHFVTFYDLITSDARGITGALSNFGIQTDMGVGDVRVLTKESHPGKVCERHWFESNKHIFPASRWEVFDPTKKKDAVENATK